MVQLTKGRMVPGVGRDVRAGTWGGPNVGVMGAVPLPERRLLSVSGPVRRGLPVETETGESVVIARAVPVLVTGLPTSGPTHSKYCILVFSPVPTPFSPHSPFSPDRDPLILRPTISPWCIPYPGLLSPSDSKVEEGCLR